MVIRCDGSAPLGMGHVSRCLALAEELRDLHAVIFATRDPDDVGARAIGAAGFPIEAVPGGEQADYGGWLRALIARTSARALILDVRDGLTPASLAACRADGIRLATIDDGSDRRLECDLAFYPPVPQVDEMSWAGFRGRRFAGWDWVILRREFARAPVSARGDLSPAAADELPLASDVLITMGGSDPARMTEFVLSALNLIDFSLALHVVVGPAFARAEPLAEAIAGSRHHVHVSRTPPSMAAVMRASRLAVASFGVSAYELAACGVPALHLCLTDDHVRSSSVFEREGLARTIGRAGHVEPRQVADAVSALLRDGRRREAMSVGAKALVDGRGASRVARAIVDSLP